jgi:hypothetical protein
MSNQHDNYYNQKYVSNYIPTPLSFIAEAGANKQREYDGAIDLAASIEDEILKVNAIDQHQPFKQKLLKAYTDKVEGLADEIVRTGDASKSRELKRIAQQWRSDPARNELETSYANYGLYQKDKITKGDKYGVWHDPTTSFVGDNNGHISPFRYTGMGERQDHQKRAEDMMNNIKASGSEDYKIFDIDPSTGNILKVKKGYEGVAKERVKQLAINKSNDFLATKEGEDYIREMAHRNPKATPAQLEQLVNTYLFNAGSNQIFSKSEVSKDFNWGPEGMRDQGIVKPISGTMANGNTKYSPTQIGNVVVNDVVKDDGTVDTKKLTENTMNWGSLLKGMFSPFENTTPWNATDPKSLSTGKANEEFYSRVNVIAKANGLDKDSSNNKLSGSDVIKNTLLFVQNIDTSTGSVYLPTTETAKNINEKVFNQYDKNQMKNDNKESFSDITKGVKKEDIIFQGYDYSDKENPKMKYEITNSDGDKTYQEFTIPDKDIKAKLSPIARMVGNTQEKLLKPEKRNTNDTKEAGLSLQQAFNLMPDLKFSMNVQNLGDLYPIGKEELFGKIVYTFSDRSNSGAIKTLTYDPAIQMYIPSSSMSNLVKDESNSLFETAEGNTLKSNTDNQKSKPTYRQ